jgi:hypothetical protein
MAYRIFTVPIHDPGPAEAELNGFLRSHRVLAVERKWVESALNSYWTFCVDYLESAGGPTSGGRNGNHSGRGRIDYREKLSPEDFAVFARLRDLRREIAQEEAIPRSTALVAFARTNGLSSRQFSGEGKGWSNRLVDRD